MKDTATSSEKPRIVILGGGFAGAYCAQRLERLLAADEAEVVLIDRNNYFIFYPLLVEAGTGNLEPRHAVVSIRAFVKRARFIMGEVVDLRPGQQEVEYVLADGVTRRRLTYDQLAMTLGSVTRLPDVPGLRENGFEMKSMADAVELRDRAVRLLEIANLVDDPEAQRRLLHFVIVGANFTGVEVAGELQVFLQQARRSYQGIGPEAVTITLVELGQRILGALEPELSDYASEQLKRRAVTIELGCSVDRVEAQSATLSDGRILATETVIWCAGIAPNPLVARLPLPVDRNGYIECDRDLRVEGLGNVWAIGDLAVNRSRDGEPYPATAQHAVQQGRHLALNLVRALRGQEALPCDISSKGALAALGCRTGVAKVFGLKLAGFPAWFLWRTVYLLKMPGIARKLRVALEWTLDLLFRRDTVQLGLTSASRATRTRAPGAVCSPRTSSATACSVARSTDRMPHSE